MPYLREVSIARPDDADPTRHPWNLPAFHGLRDVRFTSPVTLLVGENGSGKSTLLRAIAEAAGFNGEGGGYSARFVTGEEKIPSLSGHIRLSWMPRAREGFFFRPETLFNLASYVDALERERPTAYTGYGGRSLHEQSHGEVLLALFQERYQARRPSLFLLDEPETALSAPRQLALLRILHDHEGRGLSQFIIATHSPILLGYPGAQLLSFDREPLGPTAYEDTAAYQVHRAFLTRRETILAELWRDG